MYIHGSTSCCSGSDEHAMCEIRFSLKPHAHQEQPGATRSSHEQPGAARGKQEQQEAARSSQEESGVARGRQKQPGAARSSQEQPALLRVKGHKVAFSHTPQCNFDVKRGILDHCTVVEVTLFTPNASPKNELFAASPHACRQKTAPPLSDGRAWISAEATSQSRGLGSRFDHQCYK